jgi:hypothetical protein
MFYFNQFLHNFSNIFFKNLILIRFKEIEANYLYFYETNLTLKISHMHCFFIFHSDMKPCDTKKVKRQPKKNKIDIEA